MPELAGSARLSRLTGAYRTTVYHPTFAAILLAKIRAPLTPANIRSVSAWARREGGTARHNPLNTTQHERGASAYNTFGGGRLHVWNYPSVGAGASATATTLQNGQYPQLLARLRSGKGICGWINHELSAWSGGGYNVINC